MKICRIMTIPEIQVRWDEIKNLLEHAYHYNSGSGVTMDDLFRSVSLGQEYMWDIAQGRAFGVTDYILYPRNHIVARVTSLAGEGIEEWFDDAIEDFHQWARDVGAKALQIWGRPGFQKMLKTKGFEMSQQLYAKEIKYGF